MYQRNEFLYWRSHLMIFFREYAVGKIKHTFRANKAETDPVKLESLLAEGEKTLEIIKRQVTKN